MTKQRGDTIIEVMLAVAIFSLVAVGAMTIMNSGITMAQRSLEITLVRQQIDAQAEMLRYVHDRAREDAGGPYVTLWKNIKEATVTSGSPPLQLLNISQCPTVRISNSVALVPGLNNTAISLANEHTAPVTYAKIEGTQSQGLSIQLTKVTGDKAYDAYIQACWDVPGLSRPMTIGTIVRLYDANA